MNAPRIEPLTEDEERARLVEDYAALLNDHTEKWRASEHDKGSPYPFPPREWNQRVERDKEWFRVIARFCLADVDAARARIAEVEVQLGAWQSAFGTTQLTHALSGLESAERRIAEVERERDEAIAEQEGMVDAKLAADMQHERDVARRELREIGRVCDTLSPQEFLNHVAIGLDALRPTYKGEAEPNTSIIELMQRLAAAVAECKAWRAWNDGTDPRDHAEARRQRAQNEEAGR